MTNFLKERTALPRQSVKRFLVSSSGCLLVTNPKTTCVPAGTSANAKSPERSSSNLSKMHPLFWANKWLATVHTP